MSTEPTSRGFARLSVRSRPSRRRARWVSMWWALFGLARSLKREQSFYKATVQLLRWWYSFGLSATLFHRRHLRTLKEFCQATRLGISDFDELARENLVNQALSQLAENGEFSRLSYAELQAYFEVQDRTGAELLSRPRSGGLLFVLSKGHFSAIARRWKPMGESIHCVGQKEKSAKREGRSFSSRRRIMERGMDYARAVKVLQAGGIVLVPGSGLGGVNRLQFQLLNQRVAFLTTFAELALETDATVVHLSTDFAGNGQIRILLLEILQIPDSNLTRSERLERMTAAYATLYEKLWHNSPGRFRVGRMRQILSGPGLSSTEAGPFVH